MTNELRCIRVCIGLSLLAWAIVAAALAALA